MFYLLLMLLFLLVYQAFYTKFSYNSLIINVSLIINIVLFITGIVFNVLFIKDADKYDKPVILKIIIIVLGIYLLFNILGIPFFCKLISGDYTKINNNRSKLWSFIMLLTCTIMQLGWVALFLLKKLDKIQI